MCKCVVSFFIEFIDSKYNSLHRRNVISTAKMAEVSEKYDANEVVVGSEKSFKFESNRR